MNYQCPLCNGFTPLRRICPSCGAPLIHLGRAEEGYGPYSPYREGEAIKGTNGSLDAKLHLCAHIGYCPYCRREELIFVSEEPF